MKYYKNFSEKCKHLNTSMLSISNIRLDLYNKGDNYARKARMV